MERVDAAKQKKKNEKIEPSTAASFLFYRHWLSLVRTFRAAIVSTLIIPDRPFCVLFGSSLPRLPVGTLPLRPPRSGNTIRQLLAFTFSFPAPFRCGEVNRVPQGFALSLKPCKGNFFSLSISFFSPPPART